MGDPAARSYRPDREGRHRTQFEKNKRTILRTQEICGICGKPVDKTLRYPHPMSPTVDHIIPVVKGGHPSDLDNLQLAHWCCNRQKSDSLGASSDKNKEKAEPIFGRFGKKRFGQSNNDNNTIKGEKNEKENIENKPGRFQYKGRYGKNNTNDEKDNSDKIENVVVKREVVRSKYNPQTERVTTTTTTTTVTSGNGPTYFSRRRLKQKETKEEEPKEESKPVNTETVVKRRFKYMQGK